MKLYARQIIQFMLNSHYFPFASKGYRAQFIWKGPMVYQQGMVAHYFERRGKPFKDGLLVMIYPGSLPMHGLFGLAYFCAEQFCDKLVAQAYAQDRHAFLEGLNDRRTNPAFHGTAGARGNHDSLGLEAVYFLQTDFIIPTYPYLGVPGQEVDQVVGKGIEIVDDEDQRR